VIAIATATVAVAMAVILVVVVVAARSQMLAHGWMAAPYVVRGGYVGRFPSLASLGPQCRSRKSRRGRNRSVTLSRRYERMKRRKRQMLTKSSPQLQALALALRPQPRAAARPESDSHHSRTHPLQPLCASLSEEVTPGAGGQKTRGVLSIFYLMGAFFISFSTLCAIFSWGQRRWWARTALLFS